MTNISRVPECGHPDRKHQAKGMCRQCYARAYQTSDAGRLRRLKGYRRRNAENPTRYKDLRRKANQRWRLRHPDHHREHQRKFGWKQQGIIITPEEYDALLNKQNGECAICHQPPGKRRLSVDHSHQTGQIRGLLCDRCNIVLSVYEKFHDSMREYLENATVQSPTPD